MVRQFPVPVLEVGKETKVLCHTKHTWYDFYKLIDACSGIGGVSHGALATGVQTTVAVDRNPRMTKLHQVHSNAEVVTGEVGHPQVISELWKKSEHAAMMSAGYSCQPFSQLGDQRGGCDPCAQTLPHVLRAAFFLQIRVLVLECVVPARSDSCVQQQVDQFAQLMQYRVEVANLDLQTVWPCRRHRTWWVIYDPSLGKLVSLNG